MQLNKSKEFQSASKEKKQKMIMEELQKSSDVLIDTNGEIQGEEGLNKVIKIYSRRPNGTLRIQMDYKNCTTLAEQHSAHMTDLNYLVNKYKPDELAAYIAARNSHRQEILNHDFSQEPDLQNGLNVVYQSKQAFEQLDPELKNQFKNHLEFLKFIDNPQNEQKLIKLGILTKKEIQEIKIPETPAPGTVSPPTTKEEKK